MSLDVSRLPLRRTLVLAAVACLCAQAAAAQSWTERRYDPEIGSRWQIVAQSESDETRAGGERRNQQVRSRSELTIEEKLADGFRISYVKRDFQITGNAPSVAVLNDAFGSFKNIVIRGRTDASGKPVAIDNLDEVKAAARTVVARTVAAAEHKPRVAAVLKQLMDGLLILDGSAAAEAYFEDVTQLAAARKRRDQQSARRRRRQIGHRHPAGIVGR